MGARRSIPILIGICALAFTPVRAQEASAIPDFSGMWGRNAFNMESPPSGPGPLANMRRVGKDANRPIFDGDPIPLVGNYNDPILKPEAAAIVKQKGEMSASGHDFPDPSNQCGGYSLPFWFVMMQSMHMLQEKDHITIILSQDHQARRIWMNERHPAAVAPSLYGHSIGHYEGNTLVVDTVGVKIMPYTSVDRFGTPQSEAMHVVERYRLIDGKQALDAQARHEAVAGRVGGDAGRNTIDPANTKGLRIEVTVEDPNVFTQPWTGTVTLRSIAGTWEERVCAENQSDVLHLGFEHVPTAEKADF